MTDNPSTNPAADTEKDTFAQNSITPRDLFGNPAALMKEREEHMSHEQAAANPDQTSESWSSRMKKALGLEKTMAQEVSQSKQHEMSVEATPHVDRPINVPEPSRSVIVEASRIDHSEQTALHIAERGSASIRRPGIRRVKRDREMGRILSAIERGERMIESEERKLIAALEHGGWFALLDRERTKENDILVSFLMPNMAWDTIFCEQRVEEVLAKRRELFLQELRGSGLDQVHSSNKMEVYRVNGANIQNEDSLLALKHALEDVARRLRAGMTWILAEAAMEELQEQDANASAATVVFLQRMLGNASVAALREKGAMVVSLKKTRARFDEEYVKAEAERSLGVVSAAECDRARTLADAARVNVERVRNDMRSQTVDQPLAESSSLGYRIAFGMSRIASSVDYTNIERAVSEACKAAFVSGMKMEYGSVYTPSVGEWIVSESARLRTDIGTTSLHDADGRAWRILEWHADGRTSIQSNVLHAIWAGSLRPVSGEELLLESVRKYIEVIGMMYVMKPFTHEEFSGGTVNGTIGTIADLVAETRACISAIESRKTDEKTRQTIVARLRADSVDRMCTSSIHFHDCALEIPKCTYACIEPLFVDAHRIQECELLLQLVGQQRARFDDSQLIAGDEAIKELRVFRLSLETIYRSSTNNESPLMRVSGKTVFLALPTAMTSDALFLSLRSAQSNVLGFSARSSQAYDEETTIEEHLEAMEHAKIAAEAAGIIQNLGDEIEMLMNDIPRLEREAYASNFERLHSRECGVSRDEGKDGAFECIMHGAAGAATRSSMLDMQRGIEQLRASLQDRLKQRREELYKDLSVSYPKLAMTDMVEVLRRYDRIGADASNMEFVGYMKHFTDGGSPEHSAIATQEVGKYIQAIQIEDANFLIPIRPDDKTLLIDLYADALDSGVLFDEDSAKKEWVRAELGMLLKKYQDGKKK